MFASLGFAQSGNVARGKYLVERVGMCTDCHSPMLPDGRPDAAKMMKGGPVLFAPPEPIPNWSKATPDLTSTGSIWREWGEAGVRKFLETGLDPSGKGPNPPMPAYRFKPEDAAAVVAYLRTLK